MTKQVGIDYTKEYPHLHLCSKTHHLVKFHPSFMVLRFFTFLAYVKVWSNICQSTKLSISLFIHSSVYKQPDVCDLPKKIYVLDSNMKNYGSVIDSYKQ